MTERSNGLAKSLTDLELDLGLHPPDVESFTYLIANVSPKTLRKAVSRGLGAEYRVRLDEGHIDAPETVKDNVELAVASVEVESAKRIRQKQLGLRGRIGSFVAGAVLTAGISWGATNEDGSRWHEQSTIDLMGKVFMYGALATLGGMGAEPIYRRAFGDRQAQRNARKSIAQLGQAMGSEC